MAVTINKPRKSRTETISLRVDPRTKYIIEFLARQWNSTSTSAIERCILRTADTVEVGRSYSTTGQVISGKTWKDYWDTEEGIRQIKLIADENTSKSYEEEELLEFIKWHIEFFSNYNRLDVLDKARVAILWPKINEYAASWLDLENRDIFGNLNDIWKVGKEMAKALQDAGIPPPEWPRNTTEPPEPQMTQKEKVELDELIPF